MIPRKVSRWHDVRHRFDHPSPQRSVIKALAAKFTFISCLIREFEQDTTTAAVWQGFTKDFPKLRAGLHNDNARRNGKASLNAARCTSRRIGTRVLCVT